MPTSSNRKRRTAVYGFGHSLRSAVSCQRNVINKPAILTLRAKKKIWRLTSAKPDRFVHFRLSPKFGPTEFLDFETNAHLGIASWNYAGRILPRKSHNRGRSCVCCRLSTETITLLAQLLELMSLMSQFLRRRRRKTNSSCSAGIQRIPGTRDARQTSRFSLNLRRPSFFPV